MGVARKKPRFMLGFFMLGISIEKKREILIRFCIIRRHRFPERSPNTVLLLLDDPVVVGNMLIRRNYRKIMKTYTAKPQTVKREWFVIDAEGETLGRLATLVASRLRGKHKPEYTPHVDTGDYIVVINADKVAVTGAKAQDKMYYRHTGYPGGIREINFTDLQARKPGRVVELAVKGMLPKNPLGRAMFTKLKVYAGTAHPHAAQQPQELKV